jgi:hypothetical protein
MTTTAQALGAAQRLAQYAAITDAGVLSCPYPADATGVQSAARRVWLRTYLRLRPPPAGTVDDGDQLLTLAHGPDEPDPGTMPVRPEPDLFAEGAP